MKNPIINKLRKKPLKNILVKWLCGKINEAEVLDRAGIIESRYNSRNKKTNYKKSQVESIFEEVLYKLDGVHYQLIIKEDIPIIIKFLETKPNDTSEAWKIWNDYWRSIDYEKRKKELINSNFYITT